MSSLSKFSSEQDSNSQQYQQGGLLPENSNNPYNTHYNYNNQNMIPHYGQNSSSYDPRGYNPMYSGNPAYNTTTTIKTESPCHSQQMNNPNQYPAYNTNYPPPSMQGYPPSHMPHPSDMQYPPPTMQNPSNYSGSTLDPNNHLVGQNLNNQGSTYPGYNVNPNLSYSNYGNQSKPNDDEKKSDVVTQNIKSENDKTMKQESTQEEPKKDTDDTKTENTENKKKDVVKTPYRVDAPTDMETRPRHFHLHILNDSHKTMAARARVIREWQKIGGVLLIGYELYRQLSLKKSNKTKRKRGQPFKDPSQIDPEEENKNKPLFDEMHKALVNPGPDLVICDEGHRIKNSHASISLALKQMRTKRRIVLTGYPLQNNLLEYWCMVDFVRPNYLGE